MWGPSAYLPRHWREAYLNMNMPGREKVKYLIISSCLKRGHSTIISGTSACRFQVPPPISSDLFSYCFFLHAHYMACTSTNGSWQCDNDIKQNAIPYKQFFCPTQIFKHLKSRHMSNVTLGKYSTKRSTNTGTESKQTRWTEDKLNTSSPQQEFMQLCMVSRNKHWMKVVHRDSSAGLTRTDPIKIWFCAFTV